jgi:hypothetical protein
MTIEALATFIEWRSGSFLRFVLTKAEITPSLDKPSQIPTNSGLLSMNKATQSPFFSPKRFWNRHAICSQYVSSFLI